MGGRAQFEQYCKDNGLDINMIELDKSTRTAQLAAEAIGTELGSIVNLKPSMQPLALPGLFSPSPTMCSFR